ncbi:MAG: dephospho-CoA kinase [Actinobacteria bacterium]|nr:dephospho-CoA kinase [Actinomycetota bacterium]
MLRVGLTGGIGSGKSTVSRELARLGAVVIDADRIAREVVEPGSPALSAIRGRFGADLIRADGSLDRAGLGRLVFGDPVALRDLEAITHPAIWARTAELFRSAPEDAVVVHDMPLLVEKQMAGEYHLVVVVGASEATRLDRLVRLRGMPETDARARIAAQADDVARRAAADVWLDNEGSATELADAVRGLWSDRLVPFEHNLRTGTRSRARLSTQSPPDPTWPDQAQRLIARLRHALGGLAPSVEHIGSTAVPGLAGKDVIDIQVGVQSLEVADSLDFVGGMTDAGFVRVPGNDHDNAKDGTRWPKRFHGSCDPGRVAHVHVREIGSAGWTWAIGFRDWLRADPSARDDYARVKADLAARHTEASDHADAKEAWFDGVAPRLEAFLATHPVT